MRQEYIEAARVSQIYDYHLFMTMSVLHVDCSMVLFLFSSHLSQTLSTTVMSFSPFILIIQMTTCNVKGVAEWPIDNIQPSLQSSQLFVAFGFGFTTHNYTILVDSHHSHQCHFESQQS